MHRTHDALRAVGVDARPLDWWNRDEAFDILHVWGLEPQHQSVVRIAKDYGKKIALTPLLPYNTLKARIRHAGGVLLGRKRAAMDILRHVDVLLVVNRLQADAAMKIFGFPAKSIEVIPTILDPLFFDASEVPPLSGAPSNYAVCAGNIWPRKNQVRMAQAALKADVPMIFIGNVMASEQAYADEFQALVNANPGLQWHKWLSWEDLYRTLRHASAIVLPSLDECQPASCLEAVALQKPLLMADQPYAYQEFYTGRMTVNAKSVESIATGLTRLMADPDRYTPKQELVNDCRPDFVGAKLKSIFENLLA
ncbi:MAG: glycosyltransferase family 4 protein [Acidobacteriaceae bacterium]|nr:glycosyltransferase family 4 protein [Acidobacteriaceae bacterium]